MEKLPCKGCGAFILPATYQKNDGVCMLCANGIKKEICDNCGKEATVLSSRQGKRICLRCSMSATKPVAEAWKQSCSKGKHPFKIESLQVIHYPDFGDVFFDKKLEGFFYPLCSLSFSKKEGDKKQVFHLVSYNGLWLDETQKSAELNEGFSVFELKGGKYDFKGDLKSFKGHTDIPDLYRFLKEDFERLGAEYLSKGITEEEYEAHITAHYTKEFGSFDSTYYINTFFNYGIKKLKQKNHNAKKLFSAFNTKDFIAGGEELIINEKYYSFPANLINAIPLGACWLYQYGVEGNNIFAFYDPKKSIVYNVNQYS